MATRIDNLAPGQEVVLRFHGHPGWEENHTFLGIVGEKNERRAVFSDGSDQWEAYRFEGRWAYGSSAEKLSIVSVI